MTVLQNKRDTARQQQEQQQHQQHIKMIQDLMTENATLKEKLTYLENKITQLISNQIQERKQFIHS